MNDKQFEEFLREAARDYHRPPETPRDTIWARIQEASRVRKEARRGVFLASPWVRWGVGIAAALVLGVGIGVTLDRLTSLGEKGEPVVAEGSPPVREGTDVYRLVTLEHLGRSEAFLTMFRTDVRLGRTDYQVANPARDLLTTTRLLQGSPASEDPRLGVLLEDLEVVLVQIAQLQAGQDGEEADLCAQGIEQRRLLLKLRAASANPALTGVPGVL